MARRGGSPASAQILSLADSQGATFHVSCFDVMASRLRLAGKDSMLLETSRGEGSGIVAWILRVGETSKAMARRLSQAHTEESFGRMSHRWLDEYVAEASKHDASW